MPRPVSNSTEVVNSDSFLDIVASIVSIMLIMVVLEGMRVKHAPVKADIPASPAAEALRKDLANEKAVRDDVLRISRDLAQVQREAAARGAQRDSLATLVSAIEHSMQQERQKLDGAKQADFDLARDLADAKQKLQQLEQQRDQAEQTPGPSVVVENYPTPISHMVDGPEAHLLISHGRVAFIPLEPLLKLLRASAERQMQMLLNQSEVTDTVGPEGSFRLKYTLERYDVTPSAENRGHGGSYVRLRRWSIIPASDAVGEPVRLALMQDSDFQQALAKILPGRTTITIWVYPDGFDAFRQIRKELYRLGYAIATRPLPPGELISGSPEGSKSAAQ